MTGTTMTGTAILATATIEAAPGKEEELAAALHALVAATVREPGCDLFRIMRVRDQPGLFVLWEQFADQAALDAHMQAPYTKAFFAKGLTARITPLHHEPLLAA